LPRVTPPLVVSNLLLKGDIPLNVFAMLFVATGMRQRK
jgi:hypothetical protein